MEIWSHSEMTAGLKTKESRETKQESMLFKNLKNWLGNTVSGAKRKQHMVGSFNARRQTVHKLVCGTAHLLL